jgi:hypothetical protein
MNNQEACRYRGYRIVPRQHWSQWRVSVYPLRADLPILSSSTLRVLMPEKDEAVAAARRRIDRLLAQTN